MRQRRTLAGLVGTVAIALVMLTAPSTASAHHCWINYALSVACVVPAPHHPDLGMPTPWPYDRYDPNPVSTLPI